MARVVMTDLARQLGVSVSTVSRALRGDPRVSPQTRERVESAARLAGYQLRPTQRSRSRPETARPDAPLAPGHPTITVVVNGASQRDFYSQAIAELYALGGKYEFDVQIVVTGAQSDLVTEVSQASQRCDAVLLITWGPFERAQAESVMRGTKPVVCLNRHVPGVTHAVTLDDSGAGLQAAEYLLGLGHRRIAHLPGPQWSSSLRERTAGFRAALEAAGCYRSGYFVEPVANRSELLSWARSHMEHLLALPEPPTAVWAYTDVVASVAVVTAQAKGLRVPEDLSIMGFDHTPHLHDVGITTFDWPFRPLAQQAVLMVQLLWQGVIQEPLRYCVLPRLVEGATTGPAPASVHNQVK